MRKYLVLFGAVVLVLALASPSMAQFKSWGHMEIQTIWLKDQNFNISGTKEQGETRRHIAERFRYYLQYGDPKTVRAVIGFEADSSDWGQLGGAPPAGGNMGVYRADQVQLEIKHAFLDFVIPNTPLTLTAGIQSFWIGGRLFQFNDAPGLTLTGNFAPHLLKAYWWRENDFGRTNYAVNDTYAVQYRMDEKAFNVYAYFAYKNDSYTGKDVYVDNPWWLGVGAGFRPAPLDISGQLVYVGGTRDYVTGTDKDFAAWAAEALVKYRMGPGLVLGLEAFYSTGNDADDTSKIKIYQVATGSEGQSIFGNDRTVFFWMNAGDIGYYHHKNLAFMGMGYGRVQVDFSPLEWLRLNFNYLYIIDTSKGTDGKAGINSPAGSRTDKDEDTIGQEINLITTFKIYKNFVYNLGIAYFLPGDVYDTATLSAGNAWAVNSKLNFAF